MLTVILSYPFFAVIFMIQVETDVCESIGIMQVCLVLGTPMLTGVVEVQVQTADDTARGKSLEMGMHTSI